jgi:hypothetical protein
MVSGWSLKLRRMVVDMAYLKSDFVIGQMYSIVTIFKSTPIIGLICVRPADFYSSDEGAIWGQWGSNQRISFIRLSEIISAIPWVPMGIQSTFVEYPLPPGVKKIEFTGIIPCTCDIYALMREGCTCGHLKKEVV